MNCKYFRCPRQQNDTNFLAHLVPKSAISQFLLPACYGLSTGGKCVFFEIWVVSGICPQDYDDLEKTHIICFFHDLEKSQLIHNRPPISWTYRVGRGDLYHLQISLRWCNCMISGIYKAGGGGVMFQLRGSHTKGVTCNQNYFPKMVILFGTWVKCYN